MMLAQRGPLTGRRVLAYLVAFFGFIAAVNAVFIWFALGSFSGFDTRDAYRKGLDYNDVLAAAQAQETLGGQADLAHDADRGVLVAQFQDRHGNPVRGLLVEVDVQRPTHMALDQRLVLAEGTAGRYEAPVSFPESGQWKLRLDAELGNGTRYKLDQKLWLN